MAKVMLKFCDVAGRESLVTRSLEGKQSAKKLTVRTIDAAIVFHDANGEKNTLTKRCANLEEIIPKMLGVSKAVLTNVIFCHQEDEWILAPPSEFKKRLDDIFAATRYRAALKTIEKQTKDQVTGIRVLRSELENHSTIREQAHRLEARLQLVREEIEDLSSEREQILEQMAPLEAELESLAAVESQVADLESVLATLGATVELCERNRDSYLAAMEEEFSESNEELLRMQAAYDAEIEKARSELLTLEETYATVAADFKLANEAYRTALTTHASLQGAVETLENALTERKTKIAVLSPSIGLPSGSGSSPSAFQAALDHALTEARADASSVAAEADAEVAAVSTRIQEVQVQLATLRAERDAADRRLQTARTKLAELGRTSVSLEALEGQAAGLEGEHKAATQALAELQAQASSGKDAGHVASLEIQRESLKSSASALRAEINHRASFAGLQASLENKTKSRDAKQEAARSLLESHRESFVDVLGMDRSSLYSLAGFDAEAGSQAGASQAQALKEKARNASKALNEAASSASVLRKQVETMEQDLEARRSEAAKLAKKLKKKASGSDPDELIARTQARKESLQARLQKNKVTSLSAVSQFEEFLAAAKEDEACPLCHRGFESDPKGLDEFVASLKEILDSLDGSASTEELQTQVDECDLILGKLNALRPLQLELDTLTNKTIPNLEAKLESTQAELETASTREEQAQSAASLAESRVQAGDQALKALEELCRIASEAQTLDGEIGALQAELEAARAAASASASAATEALAGGTYESLAAIPSAELSTRAKGLEDQVSALEKEMKETRAAMAARENAIQAASNRVHASEKQKLTLEAKISSARMAASQVKDLESKVEEEEATRARLEASLAPLKASETALAGERRETEARARSAKERARSSVNQLVEHVEWLQRTNNRIGELEGKNPREALAGAAADRDSAKTAVEASEVRKDDTDARIAQIRAALSESSTTKRLIDDNIKYRETLKELEELAEQESEVRRKLDSVRGASSSSGLSVQDIRRKKDKLASACAELKGTIEAKAAQVEQVEAELAEPMYANGETNYATKLIEMKTTEMAAGDLAKYQRALDAALQRYHALKMTEINNIIKDLWQKVYKGTDIDRIEITCEASTSKRNSFEYHLMAIRGGIAIPMRSRCSAGQARIAALIVRIALAETFCLNCGILALDEPTTNLDESNKDSFARALATIVNERSRQANFQLLLITHDESFIDILSKKLSKSPSCYWKLVRTPRGHSEIHKHNFHY